MSLLTRVDQRRISYEFIFLNPQQEYLGMARSLPNDHFPIFIMAPVIKGPGRNFSKIAGLPSASIPCEAVPEGLEMPATYYGFASVENGPVYKAFIGTHVNFKTLVNGQPTISVEVFILNKFESNFHGKTLRLCILGRLEPVEPACVACRENDMMKETCKEHSFLELEIQLVKACIAKVDRLLQDPEMKEYSNHAFLNDPLISQ